MSTPYAGDSGAHHRALQLVLRLYEIGKVLERFESVEATLPGVVEILQHALPLRSLLLLWTLQEGPGSFLWRADDETNSSYSEAKVHALRALDYMMGPPAATAAELLAPGRVSPASDVAVAQPRAPSTLVALPLVATRGVVLGVLQLGAAGGLDEQDLGFVASVVHHVALALDRKAREERCARERAMLTGIVGILSDALVAFDEREGIVIFNEAAATAFGCPREEAIGAPISRIFESAEVTRIREFSADEARVAERLEVVQRRGDSERLLELKLSKLRIDGQAIVVLSARDITTGPRVDAAEQLLSEAIGTREALGSTSTRAVGAKDPSPR